MHKILSTILCGCILVLGSTQANFSEPPQKKSPEQQAMDDFAKDLILRYQRISYPPKPDVIQEIFGPCGNPCVIKKNYGGFEFLFINAAKEIKAKEHLAVIDGECASGCAVFADLARPQVCITPNAFFEFHRARINLRNTVVYKGPQTQSKDVDSWVKRNGGYPRKTMTKMPFAQAAKFWPVCDITPPMPRPDPRKKVTTTAG